MVTRSIAALFLAGGALMMAYGVIGLAVALLYPDPIKPEQYLRIGFTFWIAVIGAFMPKTGQVTLRDLRQKQAGGLERASMTRHDRRHGGRRTSNWTVWYLYGTIDA